MQHLPHWFHASAVFTTLAMNWYGLDDVSAAPLADRRASSSSPPWQIGVILTANYTFLNYLVLSLGVLLLDDRFFSRFLPERWRDEFTLWLLGAWLNRASHNGESDLQRRSLRGLQSIRWRAS